MEDLATQGTDILTLGQYLQLLASICHRSLRSSNEFTDTRCRAKPWASTRRSRPAGAFFLPRFRHGRIRDKLAEHHEIRSSGCAPSSSRFFFFAQVAKDAKLPRFEDFPRPKDGPAHP